LQWAMLRVQLSRKNRSLINQSGQSAKSYFHSANLKVPANITGLVQQTVRLWFAALSQSNLVRYKSFKVVTYLIFNAILFLFFHSKKT
jgi:hypothetical protein